MDTNTITQEPGKIEQNPVGLPTIAAKTVSDRLDKLVASFSVQYHQYLKRHWLVEGPEHRDLHKFFDNNYREVQQEFDTLAERITTLGTIPTSGLRAQQALSFLETEEEGMLPIREMMERDLSNEQALIDYMRKSIKDCSELSDFASETLLKQALIRAEERAHELDHYLASDSLKS